MADLSLDQVRHIAERLARLKLDDERVRQLSTEMTAILGYVEKLQELDTEKVEATAGVTGIVNAVRPDAFGPPDVAPDDLLETSPLPIIDHQIQTPSAHG